MQLAKLSAHPFKSEIETCEHLIYYLAKNKKQEVTTLTEESKINPDEAARLKKLQETFKKEKLQEAAGKKYREEESNEYSALASHGKKNSRKREGPSKMYDVDPNAIEIDYSVIKKFALLGVAPPVSKDMMDKSEKELIELREMMQLKGKMEQAEGKARFLKDDSFI